MRSGGAEKIISILANHYSIDLGWSVEIAMLLGNEVNKDLYKLAPNIKIVDLSHNLDSKSYFSNAIYWLISIRRYISKTKPSCIVSFIGRINALVLTATLGLNIPVLVSERNDPRHDGRGIFMLWYCNLIYRRAKAIVHQTMYEESCFSDNLKSHSYIIPNPANITGDVVSNYRPHTIATAGRLEPQKNHLMLLQAVSLLVSEFPDIRCEIFGDGSLKDSLDGTIKKMGLEGNIVLMGHKSGVTNFIAKSQIFVMTSNFEGLSNSLIEALILGKVCISTKYPGADEIIDNNKNGLLVPMNDSEDLASKIREVFLDHNLNNRLSLEAKLSSSKYEQNNVLKQWDELISNIIH